ncbi:unnamed protein product [Paramecium sonneborni]|uniref:Activator of Hsp90 ATPase homologue 1/2-like C-terminal domain-containing protein n=1 Tax=Paramecium sonneborni TaxID=65129 RepID=A0A8S1KIW8_9CILI|nr:unnamed protein product [Paramecium sonneborni]
MDKLEFSIVWGVPSKVIYQALLDPFEIMQYTRAPAIVESKEGGQYKIMEGRIEGVFNKLVENQEIQMTWKFNNWKQYSNVTLRLIEREDSCELKIIQTNFPQDIEKVKLEDGWKNQIFIPMSKIRGYPIEDDD